MGSRFRRIISTATENASTSGWEIVSFRKPARGFFSETGGLDSTKPVGWPVGAGNATVASWATNPNRVERQEETSSPIQKRMEIAKANVVEIRNR